MSPIMRIFIWILVLAHTAEAFAAKVVVIPLGDSSTTLKVKDRNGQIIGNFIQHLEKSQIFLYSKQGYFTVITDFGNIPGNGPETTENISLSYTGLNCTGDAHRKADRSFVKPLVFMSRPTNSTNRADWKAVVTPKSASIITQVPFQSFSNLENGCFNVPGSSSYVYPVVLNDPATTGFDFLSADFQYQNPIIIE